MPFPGNRFLAGFHFDHEADKAGKFPGGLEEQFEIFAGSGALDNAQDHFHDGIEFAQETLVQAVVKTLMGPGSFLASGAGDGAGGPRC